MIKYRIIKTEHDEPVEKTVVELRLIRRNVPVLQGRNLMTPWHDIIFLSNDGCLGLQLGSKDIEGIQTDGKDHIVIL